MADAKGESETATIQCAAHSAAPPPHDAGSRLLKEKISPLSVLLPNMSTSERSLLVFVLLCAAVSVRSATYLHMQFYTDSSCTVKHVGYTGVPSAPVSDPIMWTNENGYFLKVNASGCPLDAAPGAIVWVYSNGAPDQIVANVSLNSCSAGNQIGGNGGTDFFYRAVCSQEVFPPTVVSKMVAVTYYANQSVCETANSSFSWRRTYESGGCFSTTLRGDSSTRYVLISHICVIVSVLTPSGAVAAGNA